jgi:hypothetical protein
MWSNDDLDESRVIYMSQSSIEGQGDRLSANDNPRGPGGDTNLSLEGEDMRSSIDNLAESRVMGIPQSSVVMPWIASMTEDNP